MNPISGVEILNNESFKLNFESKPGFENIPGVIQELLARLSAGAKSTFWISDPENRSDFVSNYDLEIISERIFIKFKSQRIEILKSGSDCRKADFFDDGQLLSNDEKAQYEVSLSQEASTLVAILNTLKIPPPERPLFAKMIRKIAQQTATLAGDVRLSNSHIESDEAGYTDGISWSESEFNAANVRRKEIHVLMHAQNLLLQKEIVAEFAKMAIKVSISISIRNELSNVSDYHIYFIKFPMTNGRQKWMQGAIQNLGLLPLVEGAPNTNQALAEGQRTSASTAPVRTDVLSEIERSLRQEISIIPLTRNHKSIYSKKLSPVVFKYSSNNSPAFFEREVVESSPS